MIFIIIQMKGILLIVVTLTAIQSTESKLEQVVSLFRHGARYALNSLYDGNQTKYIWGELNSVGMRQHQTLGEIIRKEYIDNLGFLSPTYNRDQIEVYSTAVNRTVQSAISQLYGLYPPGTGPKLPIIDRELYLPPFSSNKTDDQQRNFALPSGHQDIPIKFDQKIMKDQCDNQFNQIDKNIDLQIDEYNEMNLTYYPFLKRISSMFNLTGNVTLQTLATLEGDIEVDLHLGRALPSSFTEDDYKNIKHLNAWFKQLSYIGNLAKARNKYKFDKIMNMFDSRIKNENQSLKWTFLSGHDLDIVPMFNDLNISSSKCIEQLYRKGQTSALNCEPFPQFASSLIFELYLQGNTHLVKIRSNGKYANLCGEKSTSCKYDTWKKLIKANLASDSLAQQICGKYPPLQYLMKEMKI